MADILRNTNEDEPNTPLEREIRRNCGRLLGGLDDLLPCIYLAGIVSDGEKSGRQADAEEDFFAVGDVVPSLGLLLPVNLCRHERTRAVLLNIPSLIADAANASGADKLRLVDDSLREAFDSDLDLMSDLETDDFSHPGFFELNPSDILFRRLHEAFDYVTEVTDNPMGLVRVTKTAPFRWQSCVDLLKWRNLRFPHRSDPWTPLTPFLLCGDTRKLPAYIYGSCWRRDTLFEPDKKTAERFAFHPRLPDARPFVRLDKNEAGWSDLHVGLDEAAAAIRLSHVFEPFPNIVSWACAIDQGKLPVEIWIDEEGSIVKLTALPTDVPHRMLLRVRQSYQDEILLEGIVTRAALAGAFKTELRRFFTHDFDPQEWDDGDTLKALVLAHPWLAAED